MKIEVKVLIETKSKEQSKAIYDSLIPDNVNIPESLSLELELKDEKIIMMISSTEKWSSLISTVDELLEHAKLSSSILDKSDKE
tara:strand:- start:62 stop:313 length:252 start_codon:yes stop_codon:yes gene_type:complete